MFKDKYTSDVEKIKFDGSLKRYIKAKMRQEKSSRRTSVKSIGVLAGLICICLLASILYTPNNPASVVKPIVNKTDKVLLTSVKYADVYNAIKTAYDNYNFYQDDAEDLGVEGALGTTGTASKPALKDDDTTANLGKPEHSTTNNQVVDVDETDIVKTDGEYIYVCKSNAIKIVKATNGKMELVSSIEVEEYYYAESLFLCENHLVVILSNFKDEGTYIRVYDLADKENPQLLGETMQSGSYFDSRMVNNTIYFLTRYHVGYEIDKDDPKTYVPLVNGDAIAEANLNCVNNFNDMSYLVVSAFDVKEAKFTSTKAFLGGAENVYCDNDSLYFTITKVQNKTDKTYIVKVGLSKTALKIQAMGEVKGRPLNQFSMDEYEGNLRIVTTVQKTVEVDYDVETSSGIASSALQDDALSNVIVEPVAKTITSASLYVLDKSLKIIGKLEDVAEDEQVYSVRFDGKIGYFVTFKQIDPLFTVDLSNPANPTILSELKIPGFSEYLHTFGEGKLFGFGKNTDSAGMATGIKLSMFDVSNPADVSEESTISIKSNYSEASYNHKAIMVDSDKNIIAFSALNNSGKAYVYIYGYDAEKGFFLRKRTSVGTVGKADVLSSRFVWIEDHFYLVSSIGIISFDIENFKKVSTMYYEK